MDDPVERELKLAVEAGFVLPDLTEVLPGVVASPRPPVRMTAVYWDTDDLRLLGAGVALRRRTDEGWLVKLPVAGGGEPTDGLVSRRGVAFEGYGEDPPDGAVELVSAYRRTAALVSLAELHTQRRTVRLEREGRPLADVEHDTVAVSAGDDEVWLFHEVEVELRSTDGTQELLAATVGRLVAAGARPLGASSSKLRRALRGRGEESPQVARDAGDGRAAACLQRLVDADPAIRLGDDAGALDEARAAVAALSRWAVSGAASEVAPPVAGELEWLRGELDAARAVDSGASAGDRAAQRARRQLLRTLRSDRYAILLDRLVTAVHAGVAGAG